MKYIFFPVFFLSLYSLLNAQEPLSLKQAIQYTLERNFDIKVEQRNVAIATLKNNWSALFPSLSANITGSNTTFENKEAINPFQILGKTKTAEINPGVNLNWNLLHIMDIPIGKQQLELMQAESEGNADIVMVNALQVVVLGYYMAVLQKQRLAEYQKQLNLSKDKYKYLRLKYDLGSAVTSDLLLEEGNYLSDSTAMINQMLIYKNTITNLNFLMSSDDLTRSYRLTDSLHTEFANYNIDELMGILNNKNLDLKKQYLTQKVLGYNVALRRLERLPTLSFGANYSYRWNQQDVSDWPIERRLITDNTNTVIDVLSVGNNRNMNYGFNFTLSFNIFNGGQVNRAIKEAVLREDIGNIQIGKMKNSLRLDLIQAIDQYNVRKQLFAINDRRYESTKTNLDISSEKFKNGSINSFDFRTVQNSNLTASILRLQSIYDVIDSQITILRLTGGLLPSYGN